VRIIATDCNHATTLSYRHVSVCFPTNTPFRPEGGTEKEIATLQDRAAAARGGALDLPSSRRAVDQAVTDRPAPLALLPPRP
jgi:hypothetical protein